VWVLLGLLCGCGLEDLGGGAGAGGDFSFHQGFVFIRKDDHNVYLSDQADFTQVARLTTSGNARQPSMSKDGRQVVYVRAFAGDTELLTVATAGSIPPSRLLATSANARNFRHPVFSPDGTQVVFAYEQAGASALGIINTDGSGFARLAGGSGFYYGAPCFYPDGSAVLAIAGNASGFTQLERITLATGAAVNITNDLGAEVTQVANRAVVSPDARWVAFDGRLLSGVSRIFALDLATQAVVQLTDYPSEPAANDTYPTWVGSDRVGFSSDSGGNDSIYALPVSARNSSGGLQLASAIEPWYGPNR
jgi:Tol biopolymer transport system component